MLDIYSTLKHLKLFVDIVNAHLVMKFNVEGGKRKKKVFPSQISSSFQIVKQSLFLMQINKY